MDSVTWGRSAAALVLTGLLAACGGGGSDAAAPVVVRSPPAITVQPQAQSALTDSSASFSVTATGTGLSYQWRRNGTAIAGATAATHTTAPVGYQDNGALYSVVVSNADGSVTSSAAPLSLKLSANQQAIESLLLAPNAGSYSLRWNLNYAGPQTTGINYAYSEFASLATSPLTGGPQDNMQSAPQNLSSTLAPMSAGPVRVLKGGAILVAPATHASMRISYVGSDVKVETLAADASTVAYAQVRSDYTFTPLSGSLATTPAEMAHWFNSFFSNVLVLNQAASYSAGAGYLKFKAVNLGDRYDVFDCVGSTTDANVTPCRTAMTLQAALTAGIVSNSDAVTYHWADGVASTVGGIPVWVANSPRPLSDSKLTLTVQYRVYFERGGNVYTGALTRDGALLGGTYYVANPNAPSYADRLIFHDYQIRLNKAAHDSLSAAMAI